MNSLTVLQILFVLIFIFLLSIQMLILLVIRNATSFSKIKPPLFWLFASIGGLSVSALAMVFTIAAW
ncbi:MAG: hypothetical protein M1142_01870 [Patescibacteria group bacterium]|nr:hypothetical protein [Patescibacteria group bacterium]